MKKLDQKTSNHMPLAGPYCLVQLYGADKLIGLVSDESDVQLPVQNANQWIVHGVKLGYYRPATILKTLPGLSDLDERHLQGKRIRQLNNGFFVLSDVAAAVLFENPKNAGQWANYDKHRSVAKSLTSIDSGHANVSLLLVDFFFEFYQFVLCPYPRAVTNN